ncbi:MAG: hypothetical protein H6Q10_2466 [Acidobacteria bacterium]|nr:hypothetical protein [Acidobacteriota bacterium]
MSATRPLRPPAPRPAPPGGAFGRLLARHARALGRNLPAALLGNVDAVHDARVASRRIREAVPLLAAAGVAPRKLARQARRVTRALGPVREMDVTIALLEEFERIEPQAAGAIPAVRDALDRARGARRAEMLERLAGFDAARFARRIRQVRAGLDEAAMTHVQAAVASRLGRRASAVAAAIEGAGTLFTPDRLHAVRVSVKKLRYTLELARTFSTRQHHAPPIPPLKEAQEVLGRLHDLDVLATELGKIQARTPPDRDLPPPAETGERPAPAAGTTPGTAEKAHGPTGIALAVEREAHQLHAGYLRLSQRVADLAEACRRFALLLGPERRPAKARAHTEDRGRRNQPVPGEARRRAGTRRRLA